MTKTTEQFIADAIAKHGPDKYNYDKVVYVNAKTKVIIKCNICNNEFNQTLSKHINRGDGCSKCGIKNRADGRRKTTEQFVLESKAIHNDKYNYDKVVYVNSTDKVVIRCNTCNTEFNQTPSKHINSGHGCPKCGIKNRTDGRHKTTEQFISSAKLIHYDKYCYNKVDYANDHTKITISCNKCNIDFKQTPAGHLTGRGCSLCAIKNKANARRNTTDGFIAKSKSIHNNNYNYNKVLYVRRHFKVIIKCNKCNLEFNQEAGSHLSGSGCPFHTNKTELLVYQWLNTEYKDVKKEHIFNDLPNSRFDFYMPEYNLVIEVDGIQHFKQVSNWGDPKIAQQKDKYKMDYCLANGISVVRILQEDIFNDMYDWQIELKKYIKSHTTPTIKMLDSDDTYEVYSDYYIYDPYFM
jgi:very-short-patch-repair endonuclease/Zn finger protein HypA/HybF involved in hydrogenase expression